MRHSRRRPQSGFTLIELMVVIVILGLLATIVGPNVQKFTDDGRQQTAKTQMSSLRQAVETYRLRKGKIPDSLEEAKEWLQDGTIPDDPWGNKYRYEKKSKKEFDIVCLGADGEEGGEDEYDADIHLTDLTKSSSSEK